MYKPMIIRRATIKDIPALHQIDHEVFGELDGGYPDFFFDHMIQIFPETVFIEDLGAGYCLVVPAGKSLWIYTLAVLPRFQHNGIGSMFMDSVLNYAIHEYYDDMFLTVDVYNERAISFYRKRGFDVTHIREHLKPPRATMWKKIPRFRDL